MEKHCNLFGIYYGSSCGRYYGCFYEGCLYIKIILIIIAVLMVLGKFKENLTE